MVRVVISAVLIVVLAVLVSFNLTFTTSFSLFGVSFESVPTMAVGLLSFAAGVVYSLFLYLARFLHQRRVKDIESRRKDLTQREKDLAERTEAHEKSVADASGLRASTQRAARVAGAGPESARPSGIG